tara:strand:+ start:2150 stop:3292 length:1143 start_codon:yes stop_codon:yes gene_type:complete
MAEKETKKPEVAKEEPKVDNNVEKLKIKKKPKKLTSNTESDTVKVNLKDLAEKAQDVVKVDLKNPETKQDKKIEEITPVEKPESVKEETPLLEEVKEKQAVVKTPEPPKIELPENVQKLMDFMNETGGDINDYVELNKDYKDVDNDTLLREYYSKTKPHLSNEEVSFLMEDKFFYDENRDKEIDIKRKKLALKEQVADARQHLDGLKSKYYEDIKAGSKLTSKQQDAIDFFNRYNEESQTAEKATEAFLNKTNEVFNDEFKGFEYKVGDKTYRFNVNNGNEIKDTQSDINNFVGKFLNENNTMEDAEGYHKGLFTAMNADNIANHFYQQGKADALKESTTNVKNIDMGPRQSHGEIEAGGMKVRALDNDTTAKFGFKKRK